MNHENPELGDPNTRPLETASAPRNTNHFRHYGANILVSSLAVVAGLSHNSHHQEHFPALPMPVPDKICTPAAHFDGNGIADNKAIVNQGDKLSRSKVILLAKHDLGAHIVSIEVDFGQWENNKVKQRDKYRSNVTSTVKTANELGDQVEVTLEQTPKYEPKLNRALSYWNSSPTAMASFSYSVASALGSSVLSYSPENAPNNTKEFSKTGSMKDYDAVYLAGYNAIKEADPEAEVLAGQLDPDGNIKADIINLNTLPNNGIAIHSYQLINNTHTYVKAAKTPLYITEYGDPASDPRQRLNLERASTTARCDGASGIVYYQFIRTPRAVWNTGIITVKKAIAESGGAGYTVNQSNIAATISNATESRESELVH